MNYFHVAINDFYENPIDELYIPTQYVLIILPTFKALFPTNYHNYDNDFAGILLFDKNFLCFWFNFISKVMDM